MGMGSSAYGHRVAGAGGVGAAGEVVSASGRSGVVHKGWCSAAGVQVSSRGADAAGRAGSAAAAMAGCGRCGGTQIGGGPGHAAALHNGDEHFEFAELQATTELGFPVNLENHGFYL